MWGRSYFQGFLRGVRERRMGARVPSVVVRSLVQRWGTASGVGAADDANEQATHFLSTGDGWGSQRTACATTSAPPVDLCWLLCHKLICVVRCHTDH